MEFFEYLSIPQIIIQFVRGGLSGSGGISLEELYILMAVAGGCYLVCLVFGGLALYTMGTRLGLKNAWLGFLPFANTYYAGKIAGETSFFGHKMKRAGLYAMLAEIVYSVLEILYLVTSAVLANPAYYETTIVDGNMGMNLRIQAVPAGLRWMTNASTWFSTFAMVANLVVILLFCILYNSLFRKYSPRKAYVLTVFSVLLPVRAFLMYSVRNRECMDYADYMQKRLESMMRQSGIPVGNEAPREEPFEDFATRHAPPSPFEEFEDASLPPPSDFWDGNSDGENPPPPSDSSEE